MVDAKSVGAVSILLTLLASLGGCSVDRELLTLNEVCEPSFEQQRPCYVTGDARLTDGLGDGVTAAQLGDSGGEFHIMINRIAASSSDWSLDVLARSTTGTSTMTRIITYGSCGASCPAEPGDAQVELTEDFNWGAVVRDEPGVGTPSEVPPDAEIIFLGQSIDIIAMRTPGHTNFGPDNF